MERFDLPENLAHLWLVWSYEHRAWWRSNRNGYCTEFWGAGCYSEDEAKKIERDANYHGERNEKAIPLKDAFAEHTEGLSANCVMTRVLIALRPKQAPGD